MATRDYSELVEELDKLNDDEVAWIHEMAVNTRKSRILRAAKENVERAKEMMLQCGRNGDEAGVALWEKRWELARRQLMDAQVSNIARRRRRRQALEDED